MRNDRRSAVFKNRKKRRQSTKGSYPPRSGTIIPHSSLLIPNLLFQYTLFPSKFKCRQKMFPARRNGTVL